MLAGSYRHYRRATTTTVPLPLLLLLLPYQYVRTYPHLLHPGHDGVHGSKNKLLAVCSRSSPYGVEDVIQQEE